MKLNAHRVWALSPQEDLAELEILLASLPDFLKAVCLHLGDSSRRQIELYTEKKLGDRDADKYSYKL